MNQRLIKFGVIGCGLMGREFASAAARWCHLLDQDFAQPIEVKDAARTCAMSASHFMRFFKTTIGQPFRSYLTSFRIAKAQHMLSTSHVSIAEISQMVGFCSQSYFGEVFRTLTGMTPGTYRRRFRPKEPDLKSKKPIGNDRIPLRSRH